MGRKAMKIIMKLKKFTSLLLSGLMMAGSMSILTPSAGAASDYLKSRKSKDGVYNYVVYDNKYAELTYFNGLPENKRNDPVYEIPSEVDGYEVRYLGSFLYYYSDEKQYEINAEKIVIPDTVTHIGSHTFAGVKSDEEQYGLPFKEIVIPSSVMSIGEDAFEYCRNLKEVTLRENVRELGSYAFEKCESLTKINLPDTLTEIPEGCFEGCASLKNIDIPKHYISIKPYAFYGCTKLKTLNVTIAASIGKYAFGFKGYIPEPTGGIIDRAYKKIKGCTLNVDYQKSDNGTEFEDIYPITEFANKYGVNAVYNIPTSVNKRLLLSTGAVFNLHLDNAKATDCKSSKSKVVKTTVNGKVTVLKKGKATISAKLKNGNTFKLKVKVGDNPEISRKTDYGYSDGSKLTLYKGQTKKLYAWGKAAGVSLKFKNTKTAKFTSKRTSPVLKVKGLKKGDTTLKVRINGVWRKLKVKVK